MNRAGDDVQSLLNEHGKQLFALLVRLTLRVDVAEDLLQELFVFRGYRGANSAAQPDKPARVIKRLSSQRATSVSKTGSFFWTM